MTLKRGVFLDRDGVINRAVIKDGRPHAPLSLEEFEFLPRVKEAVELLKARGLVVVVVTNQPDVATGMQKASIVEEMNSRIRRTLLVDDVRVCYHIDSDRCACRKPKPGMLLEAAAAHSIDLRRSYMVGDRWRDVEAGRAAGCRTILIVAHYAERQADTPDYTAANLWDATQIIVSEATQ